MCMRLYKKYNSWRNPFNGRGQTYKKYAVVDKPRNITAKDVEKTQFRLYTYETEIWHSL